MLIVKPKVSVVGSRRRITRLDFVKNVASSARLTVFRAQIDVDRATVVRSNVLKGIYFYLNVHDDTGVLAMISRDSGKLIQTQYTREMAANTHLPLLVLHDTKK